MTYKHIYRIYQYIVDRYIIDYELYIFLYSWQGVNDEAKQQKLKTNIIFRISIYLFLTGILVSFG